MRSTYYMWRDLAQATLHPLSCVSPCFMNIISPVDVAFGEGVWLNVTEAAFRLFERWRWADFFDLCLVGPQQEPHYPVTAREDTYDVY